MEKYKSCDNVDNEGGCDGAHDDVDLWETDLGEGKHIGVNNLVVVVVEDCKHFQDNIVEGEEIGLQVVVDRIEEEEIDSPVVEEDIVGEEIVGEGIVGEEIVEEVEIGSQVVVDRIEEEID